MIQKASLSSPKSLRLLASTLALSSSLTACSLPETLKLPAPQDLTQRQAERFDAEAGPPIEVVYVPGESFAPRSVREPVPAEIRDRQVEIRFGGERPTLGNLLEVLTALGIQVGFRWETKDAEDVLERRLPFLRYDGSLGGLIDSLRSGLGVVSWWENGLIFLSDRDRFALALPQNEDVLSSVASELTSLGAQDVLTSLRGGRILYSATPAAQDEMIGPHLARLTRNLSMVTVQVAVVSVALNDSSSIGFDWNAFSVAFDSRKSTLDKLSGKTETGTGTGTNNGGINNGGVNNGGTDNGNDDGYNNGGDGQSSRKVTELGSLFEIANSGIAVGSTSLGKVFGTEGALSVASAISFLSNFGSTNITQNVEMRTLSGTEVSLRSGQEIPYVKGVSVNSSAMGNGSNMIGSTQTETVQTGLTVEMLPHYDAETGLVTVEVDVEVKSVLDFIELSAGSQIGTLTQPLTQDQSLTDIVRLPAGKTVVIGGLQYDSDSDTGVEPTFTRNRDIKLGHQSKQVTRNALFIILRPSVTVYVQEADQ